MNETCRKCGRYLAVSQLELELCDACKNGIKLAHVVYVKGALKVE